MGDKSSHTHDPWRVAAATTQDEEAAADTVGTPASDHPLDWDLKPTTHVTIHVPGAPVCLMVYGVKTIEEAAHVVLDTCYNNHTLRSALAAHTIEFYPWTPHTQPSHGWFLTNRKIVLYNPNAVSTKHGFTQFVGMLRQLSTTHKDIQRLLKENKIEIIHF